MAVPTIVLIRRVVQKRLANQATALEVNQWLNHLSTGVYPENPKVQRQIAELITEINKEKNFKLRIGAKIAEILYLKPDANNLIDTEHGKKNLIGIYDTVESIMKGE